MPAGQRNPSSCPAVVVVVVVVVVDVDDVVLVVVVVVVVVVVEAVVAFGVQPVLSNGPNCSRHGSSSQTELKQARVCENAAGMATAKFKVA